MDSGNNKKRLNVEDDRLSSLPDELIYKILSFIGIKQVVETSVLSSRWRHIFTSMPYLNFLSEEFLRLPDFSKFITRVLSGRNNQIDVYSVKLVFRGKVRQMFVRSILKYAFSHNVQRLNITCLDRNRSEFPFSLLNSQSLKHLTLNGSCFEYDWINPSTWELPALITLILYDVTIIDVDDDDMWAGLLSNCSNLKKLKLYNCYVDGFNICHTRLSSLTLDNIRCKSLNVVLPQLKNLTINISSLTPRDFYDPLNFSADFLHLEKVNICISSYSDEKKVVQKIVYLLQQLHSVKFLTLNSEIIESLSSSVELISDLPSPFTNLKSLKIYPVDVDPEQEDQPEVIMPSEVKNYLLDSSSGATFTMVSKEAIRVDMNVASARKLMRDLQVELDRLKENSETNMDQDKSPMAKVHKQAKVEKHSAQPDTEVKGHFGEKMTRVESYWKDVNEHLEKGTKDVGQTISMLRKIEGVLARLPTSYRDKLQPRFSGLCAEAGNLMDNVMDYLKNQCDKNPRFKCLLS